MKFCNKCKCELEKNVGKIMGHQTIVLFDEPLDMCNNCCDDVFKFITGKTKEEVFEGFE